MAAAQLTTGGSTIVTRSMARRASGAQPGTQDEGSPMISTTDAEVEAVGDSLSYMYLFESSSASDSDARPYSFTVSSMQAVASTDSTVALHTDEKVHVSGGGWRGNGGATWNWVKTPNSTGHLTSTAVSFSTKSHSMAASYTSTFLPSFLPSFLPRMTPLLVKRSNKKVTPVISSGWFCSNALD